VRAMAYETTTVDCMKSWGEINSILYKHKCEATAYSEIPNRGFQIEFVKKVNNRNVLVRVPVMYTFDKGMTEKMMEQEKRTKWRSLFYWVKAQFDAIDKGIVSYEQAFLADVVAQLPNGEQVRVIDALMPGLQNNEINLMKLLPEPKVAPPRGEHGTVVDAIYEVRR
jgi:hypothetical protein